MSREHKTRTGIKLTSIPTGGIPRGPYAKDKKVLEPEIHEGGKRPVYFSESGLLDANIFDSDENFKNIKNKTSVCLERCPLENRNHPRCYSVSSEFLQGTGTETIKEELQKSFSYMEDIESIYGKIYKNNPPKVTFYTETRKQAIELRNSLLNNMLYEVYHDIIKGCDEKIEEVSWFNKIFKKE